MQLHVFCAFSSFCISVLFCRESRLKVSQSIKSWRQFQQMRSKRNFKNSNRGSQHNMICHKTRKRFCCYDSSKLLNGVLRKLSVSSDTAFRCVHQIRTSSVKEIQCRRIFKRSSMLCKCARVKKRFLIAKLRIVLKSSNFSL